MVQAWLQYWEQSVLGHFHSKRHVSLPSQHPHSVDEETPEHLFIFCQLSRAFWKEISSWLLECGIETLPDLTDQVNIMFGYLM